MNSQARKINAIVKKDQPETYRLLSSRGRDLYFPKEGIIAQSQEAAGSRINATIGVATADDGGALGLLSVTRQLSRHLSSDVLFYASSYGLPDLRSRWQKEIRRANPSLISHISLPVVTAGITHALSVAGLLFVDKDDEVIIPAPFWENYQLLFGSLLGGRVKPCPVIGSSGWDLRQLAQALQRPPRKKIILLNVPNNPTGYAPTEEEAHKLRTLLLSAARTKQIAVIIDDAYFGLGYEKNIYGESLFALLANVHPNITAIKVDGASKELYAWGLRVGCVTFACRSPQAAAVLADKAAAAVRASVSNASHLSQQIILNSLRSPERRKEQQKNYRLLYARYQQVKKILRDTKYARYFQALPFNSGYFMCVQLAPKFDAENIRQILLRKYHIGVIATGNLLRISFSSVAQKKLGAVFAAIYEICDRNRKTSVAK